MTDIAVAGPVQSSMLLPFLTEGEFSRLPKGRGGMAVTLLVRELARRGHKVTVVTLDTSVVKEQEFRGPSLTLRFGPYRPRGRARDAFRVERSFVAEALAVDGPAIVHAHWTYEYALGGLAAGLPLLVTVRDWPPTILGLHRDAYRLVRLAMSLPVFVQGRHFSVTSPYIAQKMRRYAGIRAALIPNSIEDSEIAKQTRARPNGAWRILAVNNGFDRRKNVHALIRAFSSIREANEAAQLRLVGVGFESGGAAQRWTEAYASTQGIRHLGPLSQADLAAEYSQADLLVHPALEESFGNVLIEAMARGTPTVGGSRSGAVPWVLGSGEAGYLTDVTNPAAIARATIEVLSREQIWRNLAANGLRRVSKHFRLSTAVDDYLELYERILS